MGLPSPQLEGPRRSVGVHHPNSNKIEKAWGGKRYVENGCMYAALFCLYSGIITQTARRRGSVPPETRAQTWHALLSGMSPTPPRAHRSAAAINRPCLTALGHGVFHKRWWSAVQCTDVQRAASSFFCPTCLCRSKSFLAGVWGRGGAEFLSSDQYCNVLPPPQHDQNSRGPGGPFLTPPSPAGRTVTIAQPSTGPTECVEKPFDET